MVTTPVGGIRNVAVVTTTTPPATARRASAARTLAKELFSVPPQPPLTLRPGSGLPRRLPHNVVVWGSSAAVFMTLLMSVLTASYSPVYTALPAATHFACLMLAAYRPMAGWWLSLPVVFGFGLSWGAFGGSLWSLTALLTELAILAVVALRGTLLLAFTVWAVTASMDPLASGIYSVVSGPMYRSGSSWMLFAVTSGVVMLLAQALHGRTEARQELHQQVTVTAGERSQRTLLEERARIARELHDVVAHHMSVIAIQAEAAPYRVSDPPEELARSFSTIRENAVEALTELRRVLGVLRSDSDDLGGLDHRDAPQPTLARLGELVDNVRAAGLTVETVVTGTPRGLPAGVELSAFRIVQEALSNVLRHAPGSEVRIEIGYVLTGVGVTVRNGPPPEHAVPVPAPPGTQPGGPLGPSGGHGLLGMRERAHMTGGELTAEVTPDGGYEVVAFLPHVPRSGERA